MKISKIILFFVSFILSFLFFTKWVFALENPNYKFLDGGYPVFSDYPYDITFSKDGNSVTLTGSLYPQYHSTVMTYMPHTMDMKIPGNSQFFGLSAWNGYIFVEAKKLKEGHNFIFYAEGEGECLEEGTCEYLSVFAGKKLLFMDIECPKEGDCFIGIGVGLPVKYNSKHEDEKMRGRTIDLSAYNKLLKYPIKRDGLDFMLYAEITFHSSGNHRKELNTFMKIELNMETEQGSGVMRKINEPFTVAGTFPDWLGGAGMFSHYAEMKFLDHTKVYPLSIEIIDRDLRKIIGSVGYEVGYDYYQKMNLNLFDYIIENLGFKDKGDGFGPGSYRDDVKKLPQVNWDDVKKGKSDFEFQKCEGLDILCHIKNGVGYIGYIFGKIFSSIFSPIFSFLSWVMDGMSNFFSNLMNIFQKFALWLGDKIATFFKAFFEGLIYSIVEVAKEIWSVFASIWNFIKVLFGDGSMYTFLAQNDKLSCGENGVYDYSGSLAIPGVIPGTKAHQVISPILQTFALAVPSIPHDGDVICTFAGYQRIKYKGNSPIDLILVMIFSFAILFLFTKRYGSSQ